MPLSPNLAGVIVTIAGYATTALATDATLPASFVFYDKQSVIAQVDGILVGTTVLASRSRYIRTNPGLTNAVAQFGTSAVAFSGFTSAATLTNVATTIVDAFATALAIGATLLVSLVFYGK